jgi:mono/diheme cytochrome c family protein
VLARIDRILAPLTWAAAAFAVLVLFVGPALIGADKDVGATASAPAGAAAAPSGKAVFSSAGCGGCHTLAAAGSSGTTGPNLDDAKPSADTVEGIVASGSGVMPSFEGRLSAAEIRAVAQFVGGTEQTAPPAATSARRPAVAATIRAGRGPDGITVAGSDVWVADASAGTLLRIDAGANRRAGAAVPAGRQPDNPVVANGAVWVVHRAPTPCCGS